MSQESRSAQCQNEGCPVERGEADVGYLRLEGGSDRRVFFCSLACLLDYETSLVDAD